jgi:hypothetical protein
MLRPSSAGTTAQRLGAGRSPEAPAQCRRHHAFAGAEDAGEVAGVEEAAGEGDAGHRRGAAQRLFARGVQPGVDEVGGQAQPGGVAEGGARVRNAAIVSLRPLGRRVVDGFAPVFDAVALDLLAFRGLGAFALLAGVAQGIAVVGDCAP